MWKLCIEDDQSNRTVINLVRKEYTIGRAEDNAIRLTERNISRAHARVTRADSSWVVEDLGSTTGTYINDSQLSSQTPFRHGDRLRLGDYGLSLTDQTREDDIVPIASESETVPAVQRSLQQYNNDDRLVVVEGPGEGTQFPLGARRLLIGRGDECDICLADTSVSRIHIDIERMPGGSYRVEDQDSSNGLRINDHDLSSATLAPGDRIELGDVQLTFVPKGQIYDASAKLGSPQHAASELVASAGKNPKVLASALAGGLLIGGLIFSLTDSDDGSVTESAQTPSALAVERAVGLMRQGALNEAHQALSEVPQNSNIRETETYKQIEAVWADDGFDRVTASPQLSEKRRILRAIAATAGLDSARRKRASEALDGLLKSDVNPEDLPRLAPVPTTATTTDRPGLAPRALHNETAGRRQPPPGEAVGAPPATKTQAPSSATTMPPTKAGEAAVE